MFDVLLTCSFTMTNNIPKCYMLQLHPGLQVSLKWNTVETVLFNCGFSQNDCDHVTRAGYSKNSHTHVGKAARQVFQT